MGIYTVNVREVIPTLLRILGKLKPAVKNRETRLNPRLKSNESIDTLKTFTYSFISGYFFDQKP